MEKVTEDQPTDALTEWLASFKIEPFAVSTAVAQHVLGDKGLSALYEAGSAGELEFLKDGAKTVITFASLKRYIAKLKPATLKPTPARPEKQARLKSLNAKAAAKRASAA
jgi:hypothetical protein